MQRLALAPRAHWQSEVEALGFDFHTPDEQPYWTDDAGYRFEAAQIDRLEAAINELHAMCLDVVADTVQRGDYQAFGLDDRARGLVERSWRAGEPALYGRMDLAWDGGKAEPKLLEYNADTPTALFEAAVVQWHWLQARFPQADQFNSIHERLIARWPQVLGAPTLTGHVHFASVAEVPEDRGTTEYLRDTCVQAGYATMPLAMQDIGWRSGPCFEDLHEQPIRQLFKLYPWEWLLDDPFSVHVPTCRTRFIEPAWKLLLSNKSLLVALWRRHPQHPNLLAAAHRREHIDGACVAKPRFGREGEGVRRLAAGEADTAPPSIDGAPVYQQWQALPCFDGRHAVIGGWVVGDEAAGIGIREDAGPITGNLSGFVPHWFD